MDIAYVSFSNHVCPIFTIYPLRSWEDMWAYVQVEVGACICVCMVGISFIYHITYIYIQFENYDLDLTKHFFIYVILPLGTLTGIGWLFWRYCCQTSPDVAVCGYWSNLRWPLKKQLLLIYHLINNAGTRDLYTRSLQVHKQQSKWKHNILDNKNPSMQILPLNLTLNFFSGINLWPFTLTK